MIAPTATLPDRPRRSRRFPLALGAILLFLAGFGSGVGVTVGGYLPVGAGGAPNDVLPTFRLFWEAWNLAEQHYVDRSALDTRKLTYGAIQGMLDALGDVGHSRFLSPDALKAENQALSGALEGIGAQVDIQNGRPVVVAPIAGSPAEKAGIRAKDIIVQVNGEDVFGVPLDQVVARIRGPSGTSVKLTVLHDGATGLEEITIVRARIPVQNVASGMIPGTTVVDVFISQFAQNVSRDLAAAVQNAREQGATAVILDLRNDPGGVKEEALAVASQFVKDGVILRERNAAGEITENHARPGGVATDIPMVVLINGGTASAGEIVAGAIQDNRRGKIVGEKSFGTGTVLTTYNLSDGSAIRLGTTEWLTPNGREIWHQGIMPDIEVKLPLQAPALNPLQVARLTPEQFAGIPDVQLLRAVEELTR